MEEVDLQANQSRIQQLILNLVDNAVKYGNEGGNVWINAFKEGGNLVISVRDDGPGIFQEDLARIFERFYRTEKSRSKKMGGTGLGLSIVKHIVNLYKGTVEVKSEIGKGTVFTVVLPIEGPLQET